MKKGLDTVFNMDRNKEMDGITVDFGDGIGVWTVRRMGGTNTAYTRAIQNRVAPLRRQIDAGTLPEEKAKKLMVEIFVDTVLLGWEGLFLEGAEVPFDKKRANQVLLDYPEFYDMLAAEAQNWANFREKDVEDVAGNSQKRSAGKSTKETTQEA